MNNKKYYWSEYNLRIDLDETSQLLYNSMSNILWELNDESIGELEEVRTLLVENNYTDTHPLHKSLLKVNIINPYPHDEITTILKTKRLFKQSENAVRLTIAPTTDCNFRCPYCYESIKDKTYMTDEVFTNIQNYLFQTPKNKQIDINWVGGEPLMSFNIIKNLSLKLEEMGYLYSNSIITNGYLLDKIINDLDILNLTYIQVTLDGIGDIHNTMRPHKTDMDSFSTIIKNLELINKHKSKEMEISIRVNIDKNNCSGFKQIYDYIYKRFPDFKIYPSAIQESNDRLEKHSCLFNREALTEFILEYKKLYGDNLVSFFPDMDGTICMAENVYSYLIGPDGSLYKCWEDLGLEERIIGKLNNKGIVITNPNQLSKYLCGVSPFEMEPCMSCFLLPQCLGSCPAKRIKKKYHNPDYDCCSYFKDNIETFLKLHHSDKCEC